MIDETAHNEHIAKIAALPRVDKVLESSNFGNMPPRCVQCQNVSAVKLLNV